MSNRTIFSLFFFIYFFIMGAYLPFFPIWLDMIGINKTQTGIMFSAISLCAIMFQPFLGVISDKLKAKKTLLYIITFALLFFGPFFIFILGPALQYNIFFGAAIGGLYLGFCFMAGMGAIEAYVDRLGRQTGFEFGKVRMFGCFGWGICATIVGYMISVNINIVFWLCSGLALLLILLVYLVDTQSTPNTIDNNPTQPIKMSTIFMLLSMSKTWFLILYVTGVSSIYYVFDQQFARFFTHFFSSPELGRQVFGYITTGGECLNALVMFLAPFIISKLGRKNALLLAGFIMTIRIIGSSFATTPVEVVFLKCLHMLEYPIFLVGVLKYISKHFAPELSATVFLVGYYFAKQVGIITLAPIAGYLYDQIGFSQTYLLLGSITAVVTLICCFTLSGRGPISLFKQSMQRTQ